MARIWRILLLVSWAVAPAWAQQVADTDFKPDVGEARYEAGTGPVVCVDAAHRNFHTLSGRYQAFGTLLEMDGMQPRTIDQPSTRGDLEGCDVFVIANPLARETGVSWAYPHPGAFGREEIRELALWVREGGSLLMIIDHAPVAGAAADLAAVFGAILMDAYARNTPHEPVPDIFSRESGLLKEHPVTVGVERVATFTGMAFQASTDWIPVMSFGTDARAHIRLGATLEDLPREEWPQLELDGWWHAGSRTWGEGRLFLLGEAAMCSAQLAGERRFKMGMNNDKARDNARFCLNIVRWLAE